VPIKENDYEPDLQYVSTTITIKRIFLQQNFTLDFWLRMKNATKEDKVVEVNLGSDRIFNADDTDTGEV